MRNDAESGSRVDEEKNACLRILYVQECARGYGVNRPPANQFPCHEHGGKHVKERLPYLKCVLQRPLAAMASCWGDGS